MENPISRAQLAESMAHLLPAAPFRERFQYSDLTLTVAAHAAEQVTGLSWEDLVRQRILEPLGMSKTTFALPQAGNVSGFYHENQRRELLPTRRFEIEPIGPAGSICSTVEDMSRWLAFNLNEGMVGTRQLIARETLRELRSPSVVMGADPAAPSQDAAYGLGWFIDTYNGYQRVSHTGWLHDVNSCVAIFPEVGIGMVAFINFASCRLSTFLNQTIFDFLLGLEPAQTLEQQLAQYEMKIKDVRARKDAVRRVGGTSPSHPLEAYAGLYRHPGYGDIEILRVAGGLGFKRGNLALPLAHWHYDVWTATENELFEIHKPQLLDSVNPIVFETGADGGIAALSIALEPVVAAIRFAKRSPLSAEASYGS